MSRFSGRHDLYDHIFMSLNNESEAQLFEEFKEKTKGVIYLIETVRIRHKHQAEQIAKLTPSFKIIKDSNNKTVYEYCGKKFRSIPQLKNQDIDIYNVPYHFEKLSDLVMFYPYEVMLSAGSDNGYFVHLCHKPTSDKEFRILQSQSLDDMGQLIKNLVPVDRGLLDEYVRVKLAEQPNFAFEDERSAKLWYDLNYGNSKGGNS